MGMAAEDKEWIVLPGMQDVYRKFLIIAKDYLSNNSSSHKQPMMLIGGSGVGKSLFIETAKKIYLSYGGSPGSVVRLNCAAFTKELAESEIFGHVKGAFTGATGNKQGLVKIADGGLLILDEIGELSEEIQAKLLIFIEEGEYRPVGGGKYEKASLKIIGTTNKSQNFFREDFWYRFFPIFISPIYERRLDILYFIAHKYPEIFKRLSPQHALMILSYNWPGNIRELERVVSLMILEDSLMSGGVNNNNVNKGVDFGPLYFSVDTRQTSLSISSLHAFFLSLAKNGFNVAKLNEIISGYGIAIPMPVDVSEDLYDCYIKVKEYMCDNIDCIADDFYKKYESADKYEDYSDKEKKAARIAEIMSKRADCFKILEHCVCLPYGFYNALSTQINFKNKRKLFDNIYIYDTDGGIEDIGVCFNALSRLFLKNPESDEDVFAASRHKISDTFWTIDLEKKIFEKFYKNNLVKQSMEFLTGNSIVAKYDFTFNESWKMHVKQILSSDEYHNLFKDEDEDKGRENFNLFGLKEDELLAKYYNYLLDKYKTRRKAAEHAGLEYSAFLKRLNVLGFPRRKYDHTKK